MTKGDRGNCRQRVTSGIVTPCAVSVCRRQVSPHINQQLNNSRIIFFLIVLIITSLKHVVQFTKRRIRLKQKPSDSRAKHNKHVFPSYLGAFFVAYRYIYQSYKLRYCNRVHRTCRRHSVFIRIYIWLWLLRTIQKNFCPLFMIVPNSSEK